MKKNVLLGLATLALVATTGNVQAQEVTYVPDCSQGLLINRNVDNWFITVEGGTNMMFGPHDVHAPIHDRWGGNAAIYAGKWVTPVFGFRFGANWIMSKGATAYDGEGWNNFRKENAGPWKNGWYPEKWQGLGPEFDVMINLTNWWCGYRPGRVYNAVLHGGAGSYWTWARRYNDKEKLSWDHVNNTILFANIGLQNNFRLCDAVDFFIDLQYEMVNFQRLNQGAMAYLGFTFNLGKREWDCPVTAICPTWKYTDAEGDALVAKLNNAENKIASLQQQLDACMKRPSQKVMNCEGLATVYYPINQYSLTKREKTILKSVAHVMQENPNQKYILTGWADNYTGNDEINTRLRNQRVDGVKNYLISCGVSESQLDARIDANNLTDFGIKGAPLDRAVTIKLAD